MKNEVITLSGKTIDKAQHYGWKVYGEPGEFKYTEKEKLLLDHSYQREKISDEKILNFASAWNWLAVGCIIVALRDGNYYVVDGQHRLLAALKNSNVKTLPCIIFKSNDTMEEARAFLDVNRNRKPMAAVSAFKASVKAGDQTAVFVKETLDGLGIQASESGGKNNFICVGTALRIAATNRDQFVKVMILAKKIVQEDSINNILLEGLAYIADNLVEGIEDKKLQTKLLAVGYPAIQDGISKARAYFKSGGAAVYARGIIDTVNKGLQYRYKLGKD